ncbi:putative Calcium/calmodulin-dependent protein kinase [Candidatus Sulfopaludibacter sp. SbA3]|nr:putative Calcium/calmodulin-dependent protein kinase [Candidatus Sulfopaludibacter sp. SbA3]
MVRCPSCSRESDGAGRFCPWCGAALDATSAETVMLGTAPPAARLTASSAVDEGRFLPGTMIAGRYRVAGLLGRGGMGEVYRATDLTLAQSVALKFLPEQAAQDDRTLARFYNEVRMARQVTHPNVCRVYDIGQIEGLHFISMEYVDGEDLSSLLRRIGHLPADKAVEIARRLCAGLAAAHERNVLHRDLKPANVMVDSRGQVIIMDFGLAGLAEHLQADVRSGTPAYMSPEQLAGTGVTVQSDLYALGLVLYELFTGKRAFEASSLVELMEMRSGPRRQALRRWRGTWIRRWSESSCAACSPIRGSGPPPPWPSPPPFPEATLSPLRWTPEKRLRRNWSPRQVRLKACSRHAPSRCSPRRWWGPS